MCSQQCKYVRGQRCKRIALHRQLLCAHTGWYAGADTLGRRDPGRLRHARERIRAEHQVRSDTSFSVLLLYSIR